MNSQLALTVSFMNFYSQSSNMLNQARLKVLKVREDHVRNVLEDARHLLGEITKDVNRYKQVLQTLIVQALFQVKLHIFL